MLRAPSPQPTARTRRLIGAALAVILSNAWSPVFARDGGLRPFLAISDAVIGSGHVKDEVRPIGAFHRIRLRSFVDLELVAAAQERVTVHGDDNLLNYIETTVDKGELVITQRPGTLRTHQRMRVTVEYRRLDSLSVQGSGDVHAASVQTDDLQIASSGSGDIVIDQLQTRSLAVAVAGSGDFQASGSATVQAYSIAGSGDINAEDLSGDNVAIEIAGSGGARVHARNKLAVSIAGSGEVRYRGSPQVIKRIMGSGSVAPLH